MIEPRAVQPGREPEKPEKKHEKARGSHVMETPIHGSIKIVSGIFRDLVHKINRTRLFSS